MHGKLSVEAAAPMQAPASASRPRVAYLINQYPKVSHSFIRREILALERLGITVDRLAIRGWDADLVDEEDIAERVRTRYVLGQSAISLLGAVARTLVSRPAAFAGAFVEAIRMSRRADRPLPYHLMYLVQACHILELVQASGASHIHAHFGTNPAEVAMLVRLLGGPGYSFTVHGPEEFDKGQVLGLDRKIARAKFVVAISDYGRAQLFRIAQVQDWPKLKVVHCGLDAPPFSQPEDVPFEERRFVCVGRLCEQKGQLLLLEAFSRLIKAHRDCRLVLAGDGEMRAQVEERISTLGLSDCVTITGWISNSDVRAQIQKARALVMPSLNEGLPVAIMEAMALRRAVISTYVAGIPELVKPGETGWLVPSGSIGALTEAMEACLLASPDRMREMGEAAHARAAARHRIDAEAAKLASHFAASAIPGEIEEWQP